MGSRAHKAISPTYLSTFLIGDLRVRSEELWRKIIGLLTRPKSFARMLWQGIIRGSFLQPSTSRYRAAIQLHTAGFTKHV
jgi:hypothetical protein